MSEGFPHPADIREPVAKPDNHVGGPMHPGEMIERIRRNSYLRNNEPAGYVPGDRGSESVHPGVAHAPTAWTHRSPDGADAPPVREVGHAGDVVRHEYDPRSVLSYVAGRLGGDAWAVLMKEYRSIMGA